MKIIYLHHGRRKFGTSPSQFDGITELGKKDARLSAEILLEARKELYIKAIYSSTFPRCTETAEIVGDVLKIPVSLEPRFNEFKSMGEETWTECQERTIQALCEIINAHGDNDTVICVSSGLNLSAFISLFFGLTPSEDMPFLRVPSCSMVTFNVDKKKLGISLEANKKPVFKRDERLLLTEFDDNQRSMYDPSTLHKPIKDFPKTCVSFFSYKYMQEFVKAYNPEIIAEYGASTMPFYPVYKINYKGEDIAVVQAFVGEPLQCGNFEELIFMGVENFLLVGSCGCLQKNIEEYSLIVPTAAIRDEGVSFHYEPPSNEIELEAEAVKVVEDTLAGLKIKYVKGKTWTTDAIFRETKKKVKRRQKQGAITVDMECAGMAAVAKFRGVHFAQIFYGADDLSLEEYDIRSLANNDGLLENAKIIPIGIECAYNMRKHFDKKTK